ncbi:MAG: GUN4 domain-containing protein [Cyanobacteriota bacterium]
MNRIIALGLVFIAIALIGIGIANKEVRCSIGLQSESCLSSTSFNIPTTGSEASEVGADYTKLAHLLAKQRLKAADRETSNKLLWLAKGKPDEYLPEGKMKKIPCKDLRTINNLWSVYSKGKYGFSVQRKLYEQIYEEVSRQPKTPSYGVESEVYDRFARRVGWTVRDDARLKQDALIFNPRGGEGHLPVTYVKLGVPESCRSDHPTWLRVLTLQWCLLGYPWSAKAPSISQEVFSRVESCQL